MKDIEFEDLLKIYSEEAVTDIVNHWQNSIFTRALTCYEHNNSVMKYEKGQIYCPEPNCQYHQHWIPIAVVDYWNNVGEE